MGYKALGFVVWQLGKWVVRRKLGETRSKLALAGAGAALVAGLAAAARQAARQ